MHTYRQHIIIVVYTIDSIDLHRGSTDKKARLLTPTVLFVKQVNLQLTTVSPSSTIGVVHLISRRNKLIWIQRSNAFSQSRQNLK